MRQHLLRLGPGGDEEVPAAGVAEMPHRLAGANAISVSLHSRAAGRATAPAREPPPVRHPGVAVAREAERAVGLDPDRADHDPFGPRRTPSPPFRGARRSE